MPGRHSTHDVAPGLRRLGAVALTTTALVGATGGSLAALAVTASAAPDVEPSAVATGQRIVAEARKHLGAPFVHSGDDDPSVWDGSGLTRDVLARAGVEVPRSASGQQDAVEAVPCDEMQPGDLIFQGSRAHHVAIYVGAGKMITAPGSGRDVTIDDLPGSYTAGRAR